MRRQFNRKECPPSLPSPIRPIYSDDYMPPQVGKEIGASPLIPTLLPPGEKEISARTLSASELPGRRRFLAGQGGEGIVEVNS